MNDKPWYMLPISAGMPKDAVVTIDHRLYATAIGYDHVMWITIDGCPRTLRVQIKNISPARFYARSDGWANFYQTVKLSFIAAKRVRCLTGLEPLEER